MDRYVATAGAAILRIPHTRGDGPLALTFLNMVRNVFPTRVGMDRDPARASVWNLGIPHTRGDGPESQMFNNIVTEYSPHAWGWTGCE